MAEITTTLTSFSLVYLTCMKINTTSSALTVAMTRATTVLNGPRSMKATPAVTPVKTSSVSQTATLVFVGTMCSDMHGSLSSGLTFFDLISYDLSDTTTETDKSRQCRQSASTSRSFPAVCDIRACTPLSMRGRASK